MGKRWILILGIIIQLSKVFVKGNDVLCNDRLIQSLPDDHLTATSSRGDPIASTSPQRGRLNTSDTLLSNGTTLMGGWSPASDGQGHYIQATFNHMTMLNEILTQGRNQGNGHVTMYKVEYTEDGTTWETVKNDVNVEMIFQGNSDADTIKANAFDCPIFAKGIRIIPLDWDTHLALRFDVNGCYVDTSLTVATTSPMMTSSNVTSQQSSSSPYVATTTPQTIVTTMSTLPTTMTTLPTTITTKQTTKPSTLITTTTTTTSRPSTITTTKPTSIATTKPTTATPTTMKTTPTIKTTTPSMFQPGILNPFGTTAKPVVMTTAPFHPGIPDPFGPGQLIG